jgi:hypothetical protein
MPKNCSVPVPTQQKRLLKVITCLYENYVLNQTPSTDAYFTNPTEDAYNAMDQELNAINTLINNYIETNKVFVDMSGNNVAQVELWSAVAQGMVAYNTAGDNTFANAIANTITVNNVISNVGVLKTVQKLNLDECAEKAYQVTPVTNGNGAGEGESYVNVTQASLVERVGCPGVSNLGFLGMTLQVPIADAPFNNCYVTQC